MGQTKKKNQFKAALKMLVKLTLGGHEPRRLNFTLLSNLRKSREAAAVTSSSATSLTFCVKLASLRKRSPKGIC